MHQPIKKYWAILLSLFFLYSCFPLNFIVPYYSRSLESYLLWNVPDYLVRTAYFILSLALFFLLSSKIPLRLAKNIIFSTSRFISINHTVWVIFLSISAFIAANLICYFALEHLPHSQDSIAQLFQAKIFKAGMITAPLPPNKEFFDFWNIINNERWYSQYPPGYSILLLVGLLFNAPWIINPLLGALCVVLVYAIAKNTYRDKLTVYSSTAFFVFSPFFLFMSSSFMNHVSTLFFILLFVFCFIKTIQKGSKAFAFASGFSIGYAASIRPLTACLMAIPFILFLLYHVYKQKKQSINVFIFFTAGFLIMLSVILGYNYLTNGSPFLFGYQAKYNVLGFLGSAQIGYSHTLPGGILNTNYNLTALNKYLFEWPVPSLLFVFLLFLPSVKRNKWDILFISSCLCLTAGYFFYYYQDLCFGPRFYFCTTPFLAILTVRGIIKVPELTSKLGFNQTRVKAVLLLFLAGFFIHTFSYSMPRLYQKYSSSYWFVNNRISTLVTEHKITNAVVFIDVNLPRGIENPNSLGYGQGFLHNSPLLDTDIIYAMDLGYKNIELMETLPDRKYYILTYNPIPTDTFHNIDYLIKEMRRDNISEVSTGLGFKISKEHRW